MSNFDQNIIGGKYEVAMSIQNKEVAQEYLEVCIEEAIQAGIDRKKAETIERQNILEFAKRFDKAVQYRVRLLFSL